MTRRYDKLVRDRIPELIGRDGERPVTHRVEGDAYRERLLAKLDEEVAELRGEPGVEELADVRAVLAALQADLGIDDAELDRVREAKREERGGFAAGVVLERVEE